MADARTTCVKMVQSLMKILDDLDRLESQEKSEATKELYGKVIDDVHKTVMDSKKLLDLLRVRGY